MILPTWFYLRLYLRLPKTQLLGNVLTTGHGVINLLRPRDQTVLSCIVSYVGNEYLQFSVIQATDSSSKASRPKTEIRKKFPFFLQGWETIGTNPEEFRTFQ